MTTTLTADDLVEEVVETLGRVKATEGIPEATRLTCDHNLAAIHDSLHGLALWMRELLEWAPLAPETRADVARLAGALNDADAGFHPRANDV